MSKIFPKEIHEGIMFVVKTEGVEKVVAFVQPEKITKLLADKDTFLGDFLMEISKSKG